MKKSVIFCVCLFFFHAFAHSKDDICLINTGKMNVAGSMYIVNSVKMHGENVSIKHDGLTLIGGDFYNDVTKGNVYNTDDKGIGANSGSVRFTKTHSELKRIISPSSIDLFNRSQNYIAFPNIEIDTSDTIVLPSRMAIDALSVKRKGSNTGNLYIQSEVIGDEIYTSSLRITGQYDGSNNIADKSTVIIEKHVEPFRETEENIYLFPFAPPFKNLRSGYFAGNWVRTPEKDGDGHSEYPYANRKSPDGDYIDPSQYVTNAYQELEVSVPYLIRLRPAGFDYTTLPNGTTVTDPAKHNHDISTFIFGGDIYNLGKKEKILFGGEVLFSAVAPVSKSCNWVIGNSYTSAIDIKKLAEAMKSSPITFVPEIYIYEHGSTGYQNYSIEDPYLQLAPDIPAMSVFMIRVSPTNQHKEKFTIGPDMQKHTGSSFTIKHNASRIENNAILTLTINPENNPFVFDKAYVKVGQEDMSEYNLLKVFNKSNSLFQIYTEGTSGNKLQFNNILSSAEKVDLSITQPNNSMTCVLRAKDAEFIDTEVVLLHDKKANQWTDLRQTDNYVFTTLPEDDTDRFTIYFKDPGLYDTESDIYAYYFNQYIHLEYLQESDLGSNLRIYDMKGMLIREETINNYPVYIIPFTSESSMYVARISGKRNKSFKFIVVK